MTDYWTYFKCWSSIFLSIHYSYIAVWGIAVLILSHAHTEMLYFTKQSSIIFPKSFCLSLEMAFFLSPPLNFPHLLPNQGPKLRRWRSCQSRRTRPQWMWRIAWSCSPHAPWRRPTKSANTASPFNWKWMTKWIDS